MNAVYQTNAAALTTLQDSNGYDVTFIPVIVFDGQINLTKYGRPVCRESDVY